MKLNRKAPENVTPALVLRRVDSQFAQSLFAVFLCPLYRSMPFARFPFFRVFLIVLLLIGGALTSKARAETGPIGLGVYFWDRGLCAPGDAAAVNEWRAKTGRMPAVWAIYQGWTGWNQFPIAQARRARALGASLMVTWEPWNNNVQDPKWSCANVADGAYDDYIHTYARAVRNSGVPVVIRLAHEMNGDWYPWGTAYTSNYGRNNGNDPADFVRMWRHVVHIFWAEGARNAKWTWSPNIFYINSVNSQARQCEDLRALYPGDAYVDWMGLSVYNDGARHPWRSFSQLFDGVYSVLSSISGKPMMIAELGVTEEGAPYGTSKAQWIVSAFLQEIPRRYPRVRLVNYFFRDKRNEGESNFRFDSSPEALGAFRAVAASPLYGGRSALSTRIAAVASVQPYPVHVYAPAQMQPHDRRAQNISTGNVGYLRNGELRVATPQLRVGQ